MNFKNGQVSFEFILLFTLVFFVFITIVGIFGTSFDKTQAVQENANSLAKQIKVKLITASLSDSDFESSINLPSHISNKEITIDIYKDPDNLLHIKTSNQLLASAHLPIIDEASGSGNILTIKKESNYMKIEIS